MKNVFKVLAVVVLLLLATFLVLGLTQPKDVTIVRTTMIKAPHEAVFNQITRFRNWPNWSPWVEVEPTVNLTYEGVDGQPGSSYKWVGDETGSGKMTNIAVTLTRMKFELMFLKPWKGTADGFLEAEPQQTGAVKVTWSLTTHAGFPMNAFNFMTEKMIGKDFERGLELLKAYAEQHPSVELGLNSIEEKEFPAAHYATIRKTIPWNAMKDFSTQAFGTLAAAAGNRVIGAPSTFYYVWNDTAQTADMAPALAVSGADPVAGKDIVMVHTPISHVCCILYKGGYANLGKAHELLGQYINQKGRRLNYILEEYIVGPANEQDSTKWITNVNYFVQ